MLEKIVWQSGFKLQPILCDGMKKSQTPGVQHLAAKLAACFSVYLVTKDGVPDRMEMDPNLMCSTGVNLAEDEGPFACLLDDLVSGVSRSATVDDRHFLAMDRMPTDRFKNFVPQVRESPSAQREVEFLDFASGKLIAQPQVRDVMFGNHKATAGVTRFKS